MKSVPAPTPVEILSIGREILDGRVIDTNATEIALFLKPLGLIPRYAQRVDDDSSRMKEAFEIASKRSQLVFVTGGLGPTSDDLTAEVFSEFLGRPLYLNTEALSQIEAFFKKLNRTMTETQKKQALVPEGAHILKNPLGTAPGFEITHNQTRWFFLPGVPREMRHLMTKEILPSLPKLSGYLSHTWYTQFTAESNLQERLNPILQKLPKTFELTFRTRLPENHIGLHANCETEDEKNQFYKASKKITEILGDDVFSTNAEGGSLFSIEETVLNLLNQKQAVLAAAESCTGGGLLGRLTQISGASKTIWGGWTTYDNSAKEGELHIPREILDTHGAVSEPVAQAMASIGIEKMKTTLKLKHTGLLEKPKHLFCLSTTGIAGPTGGTPEKPVGLCYLGIAHLNEPSPAIHVNVKKINARINLERTLTQSYFSQMALDLLRRALIRL